MATHRHEAIDARGRRLRAAVADESGIALVLALVVMLVLTIGLATTLGLTASSGRHASRSNADQKAYALAEAGINNATSVLAAGGARNSGCANDASDYNWQGINSTRTSTLESGTVTWSATLAPASGTATCDTPAGSTWTITATGSVANPTGPTAAAVTRTVRQTATLAVDDADLAYWNRIYSDLTTSPTGCDFMAYTPINNPLYVRGNACLGLHDWGAGILKQVPVAIGGNLCVALVTGSTSTSKDCEGTALDADDINVTKLNLGSSSLGTAASPLQASQVSIGGTCGIYGSLHNRPCGAADKVFTTGGTLEPPVPQTAPIFRLPPVDFTYWRTNADLGPLNGCDYHSGTSPLFSSTGTTGITAGASYMCRACPNNAAVCTSNDAVAELSWTKNTTGITTDGVLKIKGTIFFDGSWKLNTNQTINYNGRASIFFGSAGTNPEGLHEDNVSICAGGDGTYKCRASQSSFNNGPPAWDPNTNMLTLYVKDGIDYVANETPTRAGWIQGQHGSGLDFDIHWHNMAFMGQLWSDGRCLLDDGSWMRASINCYDTWFGDREQPNAASFFTFPPTDILQAPQVTRWKLAIGPQAG